MLYFTADKCLSTLKYSEAALSLFHALKTLHFNHPAWETKRILMRFNYLQDWLHLNKDWIGEVGESRSTNELLIDFKIIETAVCLISTIFVCASTKCIEIQSCYLYSNNLQCSYNNSHAMFYVNVLLGKLFYFGEMWCPVLDCRQCLSVYRVSRNVRW